MAEFYLTGKKKGLPKRPGPFACSDCGASVRRYSIRCKPCQARTQIKPEKYRVCLYCEKPYINTRRNKGEGEKYCSRACALVAKHVKAEKTLKYTKVRFAACSVCSKPFVAHPRNRTICSQECYRQLARDVARRRGSSNHVPVDRNCKCCGETFTTPYGVKRKVFCSSRCASRWAGRTHKRKFGRTWRSVARSRGVQYEPVNIIRLFDRDGWRCQICGVSTPRVRRGSNHFNAPELDHRVPITVGGSHTYANCQCSCRRCNGLKSNKAAVGQLPLWNQ